MIAVGTNILVRRSERGGRRAEIIKLSRASVRIASIRDLIRLKQLAGRPQDLADIEALELILRRQGRPDVP